MQPLWKTVWSPSKNKSRVACDPAIPLLEGYPDKTTTQKDTCIPMFSAALFTTAETWRQPTRPWTDEWIKEKWQRWTDEYYSAIKKNKTKPTAATWMDLEIIILE